MFTIRHAVPGDIDKIYSLYKKVSTQKPGIARSDSEISRSYVNDFMQHAADTGIELVIENPDDNNQLIAEIHSYKFVPQVFSHVLSELTIVVDQDFHGKGLGKMIFAHMLDLITKTRPDILRVELVAQESNTRAIALYKKLGFKEEGRFEKRIRKEDGSLEADIPMGWTM